MSFRPNPHFARDIARAPEMRAFVHNVAQEGASEVEARLPWPNILGGLDVSAAVNLTSDGWEGEIRVDGPGWHLWEFGTINHGARPAIRPGAQAALSRHGGRLGESR